MDMSKKVRPKITQMMSLRRRMKKGGTVVPFGPKNPPKIRSFVVISRVFPGKFQKIHIISVSGNAPHIKNLSNCCRHKNDGVDFTIFFIHFF